MKVQIIPPPEVQPTVHLEMTMADALVIALLLARTDIKSLPGSLCTADLDAVHCRRVRLWKDMQIVVRPGWTLDEAIAVVLTKGDAL